MILEVFSTQASVEARASQARVLLWTDKDRDGTPDPTTLAQGFQFASGLIFEYLNHRYGEGVLKDWTIDTAPPRVLRLSDELCMWYFSGGNYAQNPLIQTLYDQAIDTLEAIRSGARDLYGACESNTDTSKTEQPPNPFHVREYFQYPSPLLPAWTFGSAPGECPFDDGREVFLE